MATTFDAAVRIGRESTLTAHSQRRLRRARATGKILTLIAAMRCSRPLLLFSRKFILGRAMLDWCAGFRRTFPSLEAARTCAATYLPADHSHPDNATLHLRLAERLRPSDYPVLFHLRNIPRIDRVFDLGGNVGNLFYSYQNHLECLKNVVWQVYDVPSITSLGESLANDRNEARVNFVGGLTSLGEADVFLASGSLHYFEESIAQMLARCRRKPKHVLLNRTPLLEDRSSYTVQDAGTFLAACKLYSRHALVDEMRTLGYQCVDEWTVPELTLIVPCFPELSALSYSGIYFRLG